MIPIETLLAAYRAGLFPMATEGRIEWQSPPMRGVLPLEMFHVPRRLRRTLRQTRFRVSVDREFRRVIAGCAARVEGRFEPEDWIDAEIVESYCALHDAGFAHSVEVWEGELLAGGLYGVALGGVFFAESMFRVRTNASKVAICALVDRLRERGYRLVDLQWLTPHMAQFGAVEVPRDTYLSLLATALDADCSFGEAEARAQPRAAGGIEPLRTSVPKGAPPT